MKAFLALALLLSGFHASAAGVLHIPTFLDLGTNDQFIPVSEVNGALVHAGATPITEFVDVTAQTDTSALFKQIDQQITAAIPVLNNPYYKDASRLWDLIPAQHTWGSQETCYRGNPADVVEIVSGLADVVYSDQLQILGWRFQKQTVINGDYDDNGGDSYLGQRSALWRNWGGQSADLLVLSAVGDDGDDVNESLIPLCK